jgi:hypothetical protein
LPFLHPSILIAGVLAISVPILIHLLMRRRRQPVMWGAMRFVMQAYRKTQRRLLLQRWLLLAARCLLLAALAIVLARPLVSGSGARSGDGRTLHLVIDNSIASGVRRDGRTALEEHRAVALRLLGTLGASDRVSLFAAGGPAAALVWPPSSDLASVRELIEGLKPNDAGADLRTPLTTISGAFDPTTPSGTASMHTLCVLSDFASGALDLRAGAPKLPPGVRVLATSPPSQASGNVGIASVNSSRNVLFAGDAAGASTITVSLVRSGSIVNDAGTSDVKLSLESSRETPGVPGTGSLGTGRVRWAPGQRAAAVSIAVDDLARLAGTNTTPIVRASIGGDSLVADDAFRLPLSAKGALRVGLVGEPPVAARAGGGASGGGGAIDAFSPVQWINAALRPTDGAGIELEELDALSLDTPRLARLDALIITTPDRLDATAWTRVGAFVRSGGLLIFTPTAGLDAHAWVDAMRRAMPLGWTLETSVTDLTTSATPSRVLPIGPSDDASDPADLLSGVRREMDDLTRSVSVTRLLKASVDRAPADARTADSGPRGVSTLLRLSTGEPLILSGGLAAATPPTETATNAARSTSPDSTATAASGAGVAGAQAATPPSTGQVVYIASAFSARWTDLPSKPLMVPLMQELVRQGVSQSRPAQWSTAGATPSLPTGAAELRAIVSAAASGDEALRSPALDPRGRLVEPLRDSSLYDIISAQGQSLGKLAVNPDAAGARLDAPDSGALSAWLSTAMNEPGAQAVLIDRTGAGTLDPERAMSQVTRASDRSASGASWLWIVLALAGLELVLARWASVSVSSVTPGRGGGEASVSGGGGASDTGGGKRDTADNGGDGDGGDGGGGGGGD